MGQIMDSVRERRQYDTILVAGEGESSYKVYHQHKAFLKIEGKCIINYVVEALQQVESIREIYIVGQKEKLSQTLEEENIDLNLPKRIHLVQQRKNLYENIWFTFLKTLPGNGKEENLEDSPHRDKSVLIVPCDAPLLTTREVDHFISHCDVDNHDHILGLTPEKNLEYFYPGNSKPGIKMAYLHLREKNYRVNNLHLVKPLRIGNREYIQKMYQYRYQRNFKNLVLFGLSLFGKDKAEHYKYYLGLQMGLLFARFGFTSIVDYFRGWTPKKEMERCISTIMKTRFMGLEVPFPGAALDIDNDKDYEAIKSQFKDWQGYLKQHTFPTRSKSCA